MLMFAAGLAKLFDIGNHVTMISALVVLTCIVSAFVLDRYYDRPLRRYLTGRWLQSGRS
ncbi:hypothetical protein QWZ14_20860 [Paeniroseomonas aquatica]|uniref:Uncharacterized protein n=2 Tax=Paeniroseomonas aquatica TaxID=373043 RepID=A0ABT8AAR7_9PROT|nr:hypothetical protein [Paeniroseomonas aquatica]